MDARIGYNAYMMKGYDMTDSEKLAAILKLVERDAARETHYEMDADFNPADDGNFNDAYSYGHEDGKIDMARSVIAILKGE
jgi:hypothetical protein